MFVCIHIKLHLNMYTSGGDKVLHVGIDHNIDLGDRFDAIGHTSQALMKMANLRVNTTERYSQKTSLESCSNAERDNSGSELPCQREKCSLSHGNLENHTKPIADDKQIREGNQDPTIYQDCSKYIKNNGIWKRNVYLEWFLILVPVFIMGAAACILHFYEMPIMASIVLAIGNTLIGWKSHDICHEPWRRNSLLRIVYPTLFAGFSPQWWGRKHNAYHHCYPNMIDVDEDFETSPILMHSISNVWIHKFQHIYHWIPFSFLKWSWRIQSIPLASVSELLCFLLHYSIGLYVFGPKVFIISILIDGEIAAYVTTLNHDAEEKTTSPGDFMLQTLQTTIDIDVPWGIGWVFGNMQYQTLHHLFPLSLIHI